MMMMMMMKRSWYSCTATVLPQWLQQPLLFKPLNPVDGGWMGWCPMSLSLARKRAMFPQCNIQTVNLMQWLGALHGGWGPCNAGPRGRGLWGREKAVGAVKRHAPIRDIKHS
jgi:hypothetical protein